MARPRRILNDMLHHLNKKTLLFTEICTALNKPKQVIAQNLAIARGQELVERDSHQRYHITIKGKSVIKQTNGVCHKIVDFQIDTQIVDYWGGTAESSGPKAKCSLISEDAHKIQELDRKEPLNDTVYSKYGLGLPTNDTNLKRALAGVLDTILDIRARDLGLNSILDLQHRANLDVSNIQTNFPSYDILKRYISLANSSFTVVIEFDGTKWAKKQDLDSLENKQQEDLKSYQELMQGFLRKNKDERVKLIVNSLMRYSIGEGISDRPLKDLEENRFFATKTELIQHIRKRLNFYLPDEKKKHEEIVKKFWQSGLFEVGKKSYYYLKVNKDTFHDFMQSISYDLF
jgi:predicted transcriptional regulator